MRVLILAYDFPPNTSVGAQRPWGWLKYLKGFGWEPVVVTRHWPTVTCPEDTIRPFGEMVGTEVLPEGTVVRVPFRPNLRDRMLLRFGDRFSLIRKVLSLWFTLAQYHVPLADNRRNLLEAARAQLRERPVDVIIATGEPFILFRYAQMLSKEFGVPWVADYRDGWSINYHLMSGGSVIDRLINRFVTAPLERSVIGPCSGITAATPVLTAELAAQHPSKSVTAVLNGFFEEAFIDSTGKREGGRPFTIAYSGSLYPYQPLEVFLEGMAMMVVRSALTPDDLRIVFIGMDFQAEAKARLAAFGDRLAGHIVTTPRMTHAETVSMLRSADLLLVLASRDFLPIPAKLYDYIAIGGPVLLCAGDRGPVEAILTELGNGAVADSAEEVCDTVLSILKGETVIPSPDKGKAQKYSRRHQTGVLAQVLTETARTA